MLLVGQGARGTGSPGREEHSSPSLASNYGGGYPVSNGQIQLPVTLYELKGHLDGLTRPLSTSIRGDEETMYYLRTICQVVL